MAPSSPCLQGVRVAFLKARCLELSGLIAWHAGPPQSALAPGTAASAEAADVAAAGEAAPAAWPLVTTATKPGKLITQCRASCGLLDHACICRQSNSKNTEILAGLTEECMASWLVNHKRYAN